MPTPAIFLDRDGVINENRADYVLSWDDVVIYPGVLAALARLRARPVKIVLVTNQSPVGRGLLPLDRAEAINRRILAEVAAAGGRIDAAYLCPHHPDDGCNCRKPQPGLLQQAAVDLGLDLSRSVMIGDALTDLMAGRAAGVAEVALLRTGRGAEQAALPDAAALQPFPIYDTLADALADLVP